MDFSETIILSVVFGFLPSLIWLAYYLRKDLHPEPKSMIALTMLMGIVAAPMVLLFQKLYILVVSHYFIGYKPLDSVWFFLWAAFIEEFFKFWVVRETVLKNPEFNEPTDAMIYMISAALGFAAIENILLFSNALPTLSQGAIYQIWFLRFFGATLLHALSSALLGYALAIAWFYKHHSGKIIALGLYFATIFHFTFNILLLENPISNSAGGYQAYFYLALEMIVMAVLVYFLFARLKKRWYNLQ